MRLKLLSLVLLVSMMLSACAQPTAAPVAQPTAAPAQPTAAPAQPAAKAELTIWHAYGTGGSEEKALTQILDAYKAANPDVTLNVLQIPFDQVFNKWETEVAAGGGPDMFTAPNDSLGKEVRAGLVADITANLAGKTDGIAPIALGGLTVDGKLYGVPGIIKAVALYYNKSTIPTPPATTADLLALVKSGKKLVINQSAYHNFGFFLANGSAPWNDKGECVNTQPVADTYQYLVDLKALDANIFQTDGGKINTMFMQGDADMTINGPWALGDYKAKLGDNLGVAPMPSGAKPAGPLTGIDGWYVNPNSKNVDAAIALALYITNKDGQKIYADVAGDPPIRTDVSTADPLVKAFSDAANTGYLRPQAAYLDNFWGPFGDDLTKAVEGKLSPVDAAVEACTAMNKGNKIDATVPAPKAGGAAPVVAPAGGKKLKIGLVSDQGGVNDKSFNQGAWEGVQKAAKEFGFEAQYVESKQPTDYEKNIDQFATEGYDVIVTVGFMMGDATAAKAKQYPNIKFAIVDNAYFPTKGSAACADTVKDCYADGGLTNVTSLMFQEDEVGFLAGVVAAGMSKTGTICTVSGMEIPPVVRYVTGYQAGAKWFKPATKALNVYIPSFIDPAKGKENGQAMIGQGCDVLFGVGGNTGNGGLLAAKEKGLMAIGVDVDQYNTYPEVKDALITSAQKNVDAAVYEYLKSANAGAAKAGVVTANLKNGGVGLAPYHDWDSKVPADVKAKVQEAIDGLKAGTLTVTGQAAAPAAAATAAPAATPVERGGPKEIILATTTSTRDSGLLDVLLPIFEKASGYTVKMVAVGSGQALQMGQDGNADVLLVHSPAAEKTYMDKGYGKDRLLVMHNDFLIVGPTDDPAKIKGIKSAVDAFKLIAKTEATFVSRGDKSGTNSAELAIWKKAGITPTVDSKWYLSTGQGMGDTLNVTNEKGGYTLTDRATYLAKQKTLQLDILVEGDISLLNIYHVITVNYEKYPAVNKDGAKAFADFMVAADTQTVISKFGVDKYGQNLFYPDAGKNEADLGK